MTRVERLAYISEFTTNYNLFMDNIKVYATYSGSSYSYASGNRLNPFTNILVNDVERSKFDSTSYSSKVQVALSCYHNYLYIQFGTHFDGDKYVLNASIADMHISTGVILGSTVDQTSSSMLRFGGKYDNTPSYINPILTNNNIVLYDNENGRGLIRTVPYYPNHAIKYYIDTNEWAGNNTDGTFEYYGKLGINGESYTNSYGTQYFTYIGENKHPYSTYIVDNYYYNNQILPIDSPLWNPSGSYFSYLINEFCKDYQFWKYDDTEPAPYTNAQPLGIVTSADHLYEWLQETKSKLDAELAEYNALPAYTPSTDVEIVDFFNLKSSFDSSFSEYPGVFNSVKLGFGYATTSDSSNAAKASLQSGYTHLDKLQETFDKNKLEASISSYIKQVNFSDIVALFDLSETYPGSYTVDVDTISFNVFEYRLNYSRFNSAGNQLKIIVLFLFLGVKTNYTVPCSSDATVVMILAVVAIFLMRPDAAEFLAAYAGEMTAIATVTIWTLSILLTFGIGGKNEQRIMRAIIIVFAAYLAWKGFFATTTTDATVAAKSVQNGSFTSQLIDGVYYLTPTVKGYISSTALLVGSGFQAMSLDLEFKAEDEDEEQALFEAAYEAKQKEMDEDAKRKDLTLKYKNYKIGANYDKMFAQQYDLKEQKRKEKYDKIYERTFKDRV